MNAAALGHNPAWQVKNTSHPTGWAEIDLFIIIAFFADNKHIIESAFNINLSLSNYLAHSYKWGINPSVVYVFTLNVIPFDPDQMGFGVCWRIITVLFLHFSASLPLSVLCLSRLYRNVLKFCMETYGTQANTYAFTGADKESRRPLNWWKGEATHMVLLEQSLLFLP